MFKKILVPQDGSKMAEAVMPMVKGIAKLNGAEVYVIYVEEDIRQSNYMYPIDYSLIEQVAGDYRAQVTHDLQERARLLMQEGIRVHIVVTEGRNAADKILEYAVTEGIDLIVISTHGYSGISRFLMGSVTDRVVTHSNVPVLVVRPNLTDPA
jgi:nucleotide-binding universal stress UspA family protein